jgi:hypothetical protein
MTRKHLIILLLSLVGCAAALPIITEEESHHAQSRWPAVSVRSLNKGRELYIDHCSGCHSLHLPHEYTESEWKKSIDEMGIKAKLVDSEKLLVYQYLLATRKTKQILPSPHP